jgi:hypothetical protein
MMGAEGQKQDDRDRDADQVEQNGPHGDLPGLLNRSLLNAALEGAFLVIAQASTRR